MASSHCGTDPSADEREFGGMMVDGRSEVKKRWPQAANDGVTDLDVTSIVTSAVVVGARDGRPFSDPRSSWPQTCSAFTMETFDC